MKKSYCIQYNKTDMQSAYIVTYKIALADEEINELIPKLEEALLQLKNGAIKFYLLDFDVTQDCYNNLDYKEQEIQLLENVDFVKQVTSKKLKEFTDEEREHYFSARYKILENDKTVGLNGLTFLDT